MKKITIIAEENDLANLANKNNLKLKTIDKSHNVKIFVAKLQDW